MIINRLRERAGQCDEYGWHCDIELEAAELLEEIYGYLTAAADGSMSRNNSEQLASELLEKFK